MKDFIRVMKALSETNRVKILKILQEGPLCVCEIRTALGISQPTVSCHLKVLEEHRYVKVKKEFVGRKPQTSYMVTEAGRRAFRDHLEGLEKVIRGT